MQALTAGLSQALMILTVSGKQGLPGAAQALTRCGASLLLDDLGQLARQLALTLVPVERVFGPWLETLASSQVPEEV